MNIIRDTEFGGERPLFESHDLRLENVIIRALKLLNVGLKVTIHSGTFMVSKSSVAILM